MKPINLRILDTTQQIMQDIRISEGKVSVNNSLMQRLEKQLDILAIQNIIVYSESMNLMPDLLKQLLHSKHICRNSEHLNDN